MSTAPETSGLPAKGTRIKSYKPSSGSEDKFTNRSSSIAAKAIPPTSNDASPPVYDYSALRYSVSVLCVMIFDSIVGLLHCSKFKSWESTDWGERAILTAGAVCAVALPFQLKNTAHVLRHYDGGPYQWRDFLLTVSVLIVGAGFTFAGLITYYRKEEGKGSSLLDWVLVGLGADCSVVLLLGIPFAYFQFSRLGSGESKEGNTKT